MNQKEKILQHLTHGKDRFEKRLHKLTQKSKVYSLYRLGVLLTFLILVIILFFLGIPIAIWVVFSIFIIVFGFITGKHNKLDYGIKKNRIWLNIKASHIARINLDWQNIPGIKSRDESTHPFAEDLSIVGSRSILQLINNGVTEEGIWVLKNWLTNTSPLYEDVIKRQALVKEMVPLNRFRDNLSLCSGLVSKKDLKDTLLLAWINSPSQITKIRHILIILALIAPITIILVGLSLSGIVYGFWAIPALVYISINWFNLKYIANLFDMTSSLKDELGRFAVIFRLLENYPFRKGSLLLKFCEVYKNNPPSNELKKLKRLIYGASLQNHMITAFLSNALFPSNFFIAYKLEIIKKELSQSLPEWLNTWYELEAYNSLSNFAWLNPEYTFPSILDSEGISFSMGHAAHPLIYYKNNIPNDFEIKKKGDIALITGSNMSGKSTFLKTAGTNLVLAYAGSPVNAAEMNTNIFKLYTCINIMDSVTDGISYFMAEVKRLKKILDELKESKPVLYLIDEIFKGTNNRERLIGSRSYVKSIADLNGAGMISTHDLELTKLENEISSLTNFHFREDVVNGEMVFSFKLHEGPCPTTNALKIMALEGLPIS